MTPKSSAKVSPIVRLIASPGLLIEHPQALTGPKDFPLTSFKQPTRPPFSSILCFSKTSLGLCSLFNTFQPQLLSNTPIIPRESPILTQMHQDCINKTDNKVLPEYEMSILEFFKDFSNFLIVFLQ